MSFPTINQTPRISVEPLRTWLRLNYPSQHPDFNYDTKKMRDLGVLHLMHRKDRTHVTPNTADEIAGRLSVHPMEIWEDWDKLPYKEDLEARGLTHRQLADAIDLPIETIQAWRANGVYNNVNEWIAEQLEGYEPPEPDGRFARTLAHEPLDRCGLTLEELAELHAVHPRTVSRWNRDGVSPARNDSTRLFVSVRGVPDRTIVKEPLDECGLTPVQLAELHGVTRKRIYKWRRSGVCPSRNELTRSRTSVRT